MPQTDYLVTGKHPGGFYRAPADRAAAEHLLLPRRARISNRTCALKGCIDYRPKVWLEIFMKLRAIALYTTIVVTTLVVAEIAARVYDWTPSRDTTGGDGLGQWRYYHSSTGYGDLVPNQDGHWVIWFHRPYHVQTNRVGLRNTEEPSNNAFRILAVGDSLTFGPYLANEDAWPAWAENYVRQYYHSTDRVQVFNAGIAGYTIADELAYLKEKGADFHPGLVVLAVCENDVDDLRKEHNGVVQRPEGNALSNVERVIKAIARSSALGNLAVELKTQINFSALGIDTRRGEGNALPPSEVSAEYDRLARRYGELFRETVTLLKSRQIKLAVVFIPSSSAVDDSQASQIEPLIKTLTTETETPYLDLTPIMKREPDPAARLYLLQKDVTTGQMAGNGHLSREGGAAVGHAVADWLIGSNLIPKL